MNSQQGFGFNQSFGFGKGGFQNPATTATTNQPFGAWQNPQPQNAFGFGQQTPSGFGTPSQTPFGGFGQTQQTQTATSNAFGSTKPFGFSQPQTGFGFRSGGFNNSSLQQNTTPFGVPGPSSASGAGTTSSSVQKIDPRLTGTREPKFDPYKDREPTGAIQSFMNITAMEQFRLWSPEELRLYDYELGRRPGVEQPLVAQPTQIVPSIINATTQTLQTFQFPQQQLFNQPQGQPQFAQQQLFNQPQGQPQGQPQFAQQQQPMTPFTQQFAQQPTQFAFQQNLQPQTPATIAALNNPYNHRYTGSLYYRLHGTNNPPPLVFETKLTPKLDKGKEFTLQSQQQTGLSNTVTSQPPSSSTISNIFNVPKVGQIPKSTTQALTPNAFQTVTTAQIVSTLASKTPIVTTPIATITTKPAITASSTILSRTSSITKDKQKEGNSDNELEFFSEKKTRTTPLPSEEYKKIHTEADFPRKKRREPIYHDGVLTLKDIKEPTWGYEKSYRRIVPKIHSIGDSEKDLLEQLKVRDKPITPPKSLMSTTEVNKKNVPGSEVPPDSDVEARLVYELLLRPRRDGPYAYREEYDGTWTPLYGDSRDEKSKWEPIKWKQQVYYKEYVKDVKRTKFPITESRYEAPSWWDKHPYKPVPKELVKDMDKYDLSNEAFAEDIVMKMGLRPEPPKVQVDALSKQVIVKLFRVQKKPAEWTETKIVAESCNCCGTMVQKSKEEKMFFEKLHNPLIGGFESQPLNQPWVFVYAALPGEYEDRTPTYQELLNKHKSGIPQRNMYILDAPPRMPRVDLTNIIEGEIEFSKIVKEDVHKICHQDKKCNCSYAKKEPEVKQAQTIPRSHFYCYERLGKKPREDKPTTFQRVHGYQPFSKQKTPEPEKNKPTKKHRILVLPQDED